ncbi:MAG TPA: transposase [Blastocatellia bacterium]|nr:transposase [Blastocatellia bacterium]
MNKNLFDLYTDYLLCSFGPVTATGLSQLVDGAVSHDQITRLLAGEEQRSAHLWQKVKPLVRQVEAPEGVIIIDDTVAEKAYTDENELICWPWDNAKERPVKGINLLTALSRVGDVSLPVAFDLVTKTETYVDPKTKQEKRRSAISKNARFRTLVRACVHHQIPFQSVLADLWYASAENFKFVVQVVKKHFVMPLKGNRKVALSVEEQQAGRYTTVEQLALIPGQTREIWVEDVPFALLLTKEVFTNKDGSTGERYVVTDDLTLDANRITKLYQKRWSVEVYHEALKQNASLTKSPTRTETTQRNHLFASLCAYVKLESVKLKTGLNQFALKSKIYAAALKTAYQELVNLAPVSLGA